MSPHDAIPVHSSAAYGLLADLLLIAPLTPLVSTTEIYVSRGG